VDLKSPTGGRTARRRSPRLRHYRYVGLSRQLWIRRGVFLLGAMIIGLAAVAFAKLADQSQAAYFYLMARWPWAPFIITPLGFAGLAYTTARWFPEATGSGIPQVIAARRSKNDAFRRRLLSAKTMIAKIVMTSLALVVGGSVGREGPTVQIGASVMFAVAGKAGIGRHNGLVLAGSAAGIAAAFNAPIAGILFAIEEVAKSFAGRINELVIASVAIAGGVSWLLLGNYAYFGDVSARMASATDWIAVPVCALLGGVMGGSFSRSLVVLIRKPPPFIASLRNNPALFAGLCGLIVAIASVATAGYASGNGYGETHAGLVTGEHIPVWYGPLKLVATLLSSASGVPGGLFSPSLAVGAGLGSMVTPIFTFIEPRALMLLMTVGYFAAVVQSPLTAVVIVMEMTSERDMVIPLMATSLLAAGVSRLIQREPLYHALSRGFTPTAAETKT
jgi:H+/Cl- antiporter ClcA